MPAACSCGRQVLYRVLLPEPAGKKSESSPSHGPTVALLKTPSEESPVLPVERTSAKTLLYAPTMKSVRTSMICCSVGYLRTRVEAWVNLGRPFTGCRGLGPLPTPSI